MVGAFNKLAPLIYLKLKSRRKHKRTTWHIIYDSNADGESNVFRGTSTSFKVLLRIAFQESINSESLIVCFLWSVNWVCCETMTITLKNLLNCGQLTEMTKIDPSNVRSQFKLNHHHHHHHCWMHEHNVIAKLFPIIYIKCNSMCPVNLSEKRNWQRKWTTLSWLRMFMYASLHLH